MPDTGVARWMFGQTDADDAKHSCSPALCSLDCKKHGDLERQEAEAHEKLISGLYGTEKVAKDEAKRAAELAYRAQQQEGQRGAV